MTCTGPGSLLRQACMDPRHALETHTTLMLDTTTPVISYCNESLRNELKDQSPKVLKNYTHYFGKIGHPDNSRVCKVGSNVGQHS